MNKAELIDHIATGADIPRFKAELALNTIIFGIIDAVSANESVVLASFGSFSQIHRTARVGRNPITGQEIEIPAGKTIKFKAAAAFKDGLNGR